MPETKHRSSRNTKSRRVHIRLDAVADRRLKEANLHYNSLLGLDASQSLIIRRALGHFIIHLRDQRTQMDEMTPKDRAELRKLLAVK